jgi:UDP-N-acetylglucosamine 3-dehydrogenase
MIKFAVIGAGIMGQNHIRVLKSMTDIELSAICDPVADTFPGIKRYPSINSLFKSEKIDAAIIATPTSTHEKLALACASKGIHILIEKPVAASLVQAQRIAKAVNKAGIHAAVGHVERFNPAVRSLRDELKGKKILSVTAMRIGHIPPRKADTGVLLDLAVHDIDLISFITGKKIINKNIYKSRKLHKQYEDNAVLSFELEDKTVASITTNWLSPFKKRKIEIATAEAYYEADLIAQQVVAYSAYQDSGSFVTRACRVARAEPLRQELLEFINFIKSGKPGDLATIADGMRTLEILS